MTTPMDICPRCRLNGYYWAKADKPCRQCGWYIEQQLPTIEEGTIIRGTLVTIDILNAVSEWLVGDIKQSYEFFYRMYELIDEIEETASDLDMTLVALREVVAEVNASASEFLNEEILTYMDELGAREDTYFGTHPGDGSDFGFWRFEEEE